MKMFLVSGVGDQDRHGELKEDSTRPAVKCSICLISNFRGEVKIIDKVITFLRLAKYYREGGEDEI
jgi:hypothetical protein